MSEEESKLYELKAENAILKQDILDRRTRENMIFERLSRISRDTDQEYIDKLIRTNNRLRRTNRALALGMFIILIICLYLCVKLGIKTLSDILPSFITNICAVFDTAQI